MTRGDILRVENCRIGITDLSDHSTIYLIGNLTTRKRNSIWRLNVGILNNKKVVEEIKREIKSDTKKKIMEKWTLAFLGMFRRQ